MSRPRDPIDVVGREMRAFIDRLLELGGVRDRRARVAFATLMYTAAWTKLGDRVTLGQIAATARIPGDTPERPRWAREALNELANLEVLAWTPGRGRGRAGTLSLAPQLARQDCLVAVTRTVESPAESVPNPPPIRSQIPRRIGGAPEGLTREGSSDVDDFELLSVEERRRIAAEARAAFALATGSAAS